MTPLPDRFPVRSTWCALRFLALLLLIALGLGSTLRATVAVNGSQIVREFTRGPVGANIDFLIDDDSLRPTGAASFTSALTTLSPSFLRFPEGDTGDNYLWTTQANSDAPVTTSDSIPQPLRPREGDPTLWPGGYYTGTNGRFTSATVDFDQFMAKCQAIGAEPIVIVPYDNAKELTSSTQALAPTVAQLVASAAAWVKYANITKGYNVKYWEIGNETYLSNGITVTRYIQDLQTYSAAMKAVDPTIKVGANGNSSWFNTIVQNAGGSIDFLSVHNYPLYQWKTNYSYYLAATRDLNNEAESALNAITTYGGTNASRLTLAVTEMGPFDWGTLSNTGWPMINDIGHALVGFDLMGQTLSVSKVEMTLYWATRWINNRPVINPTAANLLSNPGFESGLTGWSSAGSVAVTGSSTYIKSGTRSAELGSGGYLYQSIPVTAGQTYTYTAWARTASTASWSGIGVDFYNASSTKIGSSSSIQIQATGNGAGSFVQLWSTMVAPAGSVSATPWGYSGVANTHLDDLYFAETSWPETFDLLLPDNTPSVAGQTFTLWTRYLRERLIGLTNNDSNITAFASASSSNGGSTLWLLNKQTSSRATTVTLSNLLLSASASRTILRGTTATDLAPVLADSTPISVTSSGTASLTLDPLSITVLTLDPAPRSLGATALSSTSVRVNWSDASINETGFTIERAPLASGSWSAVATVSGTSWDDTSVQPGESWRYRVRANGPGGSTALSGTNVSASSWSALEQWRNDQFGDRTGTGPAADTADPDQDGLPNLAEYALGSGPQQPSIATRPGGTVVGGHLSLTFQRQARTDLTYHVDGAYALMGPWTELWQSSGTSNVAGAVTIADTDTTTSATARYLRLRVTLP